MYVNITQEDFTHLFQTAVEWQRYAPWSSDRFECDNVILQDWRYAYWIGDAYANVILAKSYLDANSCSYQVIYDMATHPNGDLLGWVILTDYDWKQVQR